MSFTRRKTQISRTLHYEALIRFLKSLLHELDFFTIKKEINKQKTVMLKKKNVSYDGSKDSPIEENTSASLQAAILSIVIKFTEES